jgi:hypothetical protein
MIDSHGDDFDQRNVFLHLALGMVSASQRLDRVLSRHGRSTEATEPGPLGPEDEMLLDFVLGLVSFRDHALAALSSAHRAPRLAPRRPEGSSPRDLLR